MTKIKICGLTRPADIDCVNDLKVDYAGFVLFFPKSSRHIEISQAQALLRQLDEGIIPVAVTVSPDMEQLGQIEAAGFGLIQIHGRLRPEILEKTTLPVWRACNVREGGSCQSIEVHDKITGYVFDGMNPGGGRTFDWELLQSVRPQKGDLILAGGLCPDNVQAGIRTVSPDVVDVSSGVEGAGGKKSPDLIRLFVENVRRKEDYDS